MANALAKASLAIYVILILPVLYLIVRHRRNGFLGWLFLSIFCTIRIVGGALAMKNPPSSAASIISSVGLSPLLLATAGILHEARLHLIQGIDKKLEWVQALFYHMLVIAGLALTAAGSVKLEHFDNPDDYNKGRKIVKVGIAILAVAWGILVGWAVQSFLVPRVKNSSVASAGKTLLTTVCFALIFIGIRVFYSVAALSTQKAYLSPINGSLTIRVLLSFLPEVIVTISFICAGFMTQDAANLVPEEMEETPRPRSHKSRRQREAYV